jgi:hypothetical protein
MHKNSIDLDELAMAVAEHLRMQLVRADEVHAQPLAVHRVPIHLLADLVGDRGILKFDKTVPTIPVCFGVT